MKIKSLFFFAGMILFTPFFVSAYTITDNGGECGSVGTWNQETKTCTLGGDVSGWFHLASDGITLDGAGHSVLNTATSTGILIRNNKDITIKNTAVNGFTYGISLVSASNVSIENNIYQFDTSKEAGKYLEKILEDGDIILIKGSQGSGTNKIRMEQTVEEIMAEPEKAGELLVRQGEEWTKR